ncbi:MAG: exodeoxyribonuclease I [Gammaproteobacteria bacterium]|nr:exodeoxyribonuclease I [Gammaproteobacteria bacterium]
MTNPSIFWYDFETFGNDPRRDRASQVAGLRTDLDLNVIGDPLNLYCQPANDFLPSPMACLITGITPQHALKEGLSEAEFIKRLHNELNMPGTCGVGYNSIRFDDEVTRQLLYRNFIDPYKREYNNYNSRWDIIDMVRLCAATRPDGINWPRKDNGRLSFKLEDLTKANGIEHDDAHDALADVKATIAIARLIKQYQPRLFDYVYGLRRKKKVMELINLDSQQLLLHVSGLYQTGRGCLGLVMPLCAHPHNTNGIIVCDLRIDPESWMYLSEAELQQRLFTPSSELPEGVDRIPLVNISTNRCPVVTTPAILTAEQATEFEFDLERSEKYRDKLLSKPGLAKRVKNLYRSQSMAPETDPDYMLYAGFFSDHDMEYMKLVTTTSAEDLGRLDLPFKDRRLKEMLFRYRARNFPESLNQEEQKLWEEFRLARINDPNAVESYQNDLAKAKEAASTEQHALLDELESYVRTLHFRTNKSADSMAPV